MDAVRIVIDVTESGSDLGIQSADTTAQGEQALELGRLGSAR